MTELSPEGEELVRAGRQADLPSDADRERVRRALEARLGLPSGVGEAGAGASIRRGANPAAQWLHSRWVARAGLVGLAGLAAAALFFTLRGQGAGPRSASPSAAPSAAPLRGEPPQTNEPPRGESPQASEPPRGESPQAGEPEAQRPSASIHAHPSGGARAQSSLSEEVALLSRAETDLHAGRSESALRSLDEHERRFPHGTLEQERIAARAQALCALGRFAEAQAPLEQLARTAPNSPNEERARQACQDAAH
jgi:hypothetical protein